VLPSGLASRKSVAYLLRAGGSSSGLAGLGLHDMRQSQISSSNHLGECSSIVLCCCSGSGAVWAFSHRASVEFLCIDRQGGIEPAP
jgi:hypothetical protein